MRPPVGDLVAGGDSIALLGRRFGDNWKLALEGRLFVSDDPGEPLCYFRRDHNVQLDLQYHY